MNEKQFPERMKDGLIRIYGGPACGAGESVSRSFPERVRFLKTVENSVQSVLKICSYSYIM